MGEEESVATCDWEVRSGKERERSTGEATFRVQRKAEQWASRMSNEVSVLQRVIVRSRERVEYISVSSDTTCRQGDGDVPDETMNPFNASV